MSYSKPIRYAIRRLGWWSFFKYGLILGAAAGAFPSLVASSFIMAIASALRQFLEGLRAVGQTVSVLDRFEGRISFDFVSLFHLSDTLQRLGFVADHTWPFGIFLFVLLMATTAITGGIAATIAAIVYNIVAKRTGGLEIEIEQVTSRS